MGRQRNIHSKEHLRLLRKSHAERRKAIAIGFYKEGGKTKPITKKKSQKTRVVNKVAPATPKNFGWKKGWKQKKGSRRYEVLWTKGEQYLGVECLIDDRPMRIIRFEVLWGNNDTGDLDVIEAFDDVREAVEYAEKWIVDREIS